MKGDSELAELDRETVRVGEMNLRDAEGKFVRAQDIAVDEDAARRNLLDEIDKNLTDFDRAWIEDYRKLNALMSGYINETSLLLSGVRKATTDNYIHINVDQDTNPEQNTGIRYDNSVGNPGWLNHRVNSAKPVLLVGLVQQVNTSIENTGAVCGHGDPAAERGEDPEQYAGRQDAVYAGRKDMGQGGKSVPEQGAGRPVRGEGQPGSGRRVV